jgi:dTDP-4-dehydrorhamnose reductase
LTKILLTGARGQIGWELRSALAPLGEIVALDRSSMDLADPDSVRRAIRDAKPDLIVNAAAYTAVDRAESERETAYQVNAIAPGIMAEEAKRIDGALIHYSTDYVFDGEKPEPYLESDTAHPLNIYGASKLAGEQAIQQTGARHLILRTSWVYGGRGNNFLLTILTLARQRNALPVVDDQIGAPTWSRLIAQATALLAARGLPGDQGDGVCNLTAGGQTSWYGFARAILELTPVDAQRRLDPSRLVAVPSAQYPTPARRPRNSVLSQARLERDFELTMPDWKYGLRLCLQEVQSAPRS